MLPPYTNVSVVCTLPLLVHAVLIPDFQGPATVVVTPTVAPTSLPLFRSRKLDHMACMLPTLTRSPVSHPLYSSNSYPHTYKNHEGFTFAGCTGTLAEFPILKNGKVFDGSSGPGPDRIILEYVIIYFRGNLMAHSFTDSASGGVCGCITHTGALPGGFHQCT